MTVAKISGSLTKPAQAGLNPYVQEAYDNPTRHLYAVVMLTHVERTQPAPGADVEPAVKLCISRMEVARKAQESALKGTLDALTMQRTATGDMLPTGEVRLSDATIRDTEGAVNAIQAAELQVALGRYRSELVELASAHPLSESELRNRIRKITNRMGATLHAGAGDAS